MYAKAGIFLGAQMSTYQQVLIWLFHQNTWLKFHIWKQSLGVWGSYRWIVLNVLVYVSHNPAGTLMKIVAGKLVQGLNLRIWKPSVGEQMLDLCGLCWLCYIYNPESSQSSTEMIIPPGHLIEIPHSKSICWCIENCVSLS